jgi:hypothetical protein
MKAPARPSCGCHAAPDPFAAFAWEALRAVSMREPPRDRGRLRVDRAALRQALGGNTELAETLEAKATGRPGANVAKLWSFLTASLYTSGDLPVLSVREQAQNSIDAIRAAIRARQIRKTDGQLDVEWDADRRALTVSDNGIGMDARTILDVFLSLGSTGKGDATDSDEAAGGFGVAKAVILGASQSFRWELHSRDNLAVSNGADADVEVFAAPWRQGTRITIHDVADDFNEVWDYARQEYVPLLDRLQELLAANDLPGIRLTLNGEEVRPLFSRRGGSRVRVEGSWGHGTEATIKAYRRPPGDRLGAYYVRLNGLFQFRESARRGNLKADVVVDLRTTVRPGQSGYPLNAARDALQDRARWAFSDLVEEVERENESVGRSQEDEVFEPDADDPTLRRGAADLADLTAEAFDDPDFQKALAEAAGGIADFYAERVKDPGVEAPAASHAPAGTRASQADDGPTRGIVLPPGMAVAAGDPSANTAPEAPAGPTDAARQLRDLLTNADEVVRGNGGGGGLLSLSPSVVQVLDRAERGDTLTEGDVVTLQDAISRAADSAIGPAGGGLLQAATVARSGGHALSLLPADTAAQRRSRVKRNPFGRLAGLRISKKNYDRRRAARFKKRFDNWIPHLTVWDATLRLIAAEARIRRSFKPGFVLDNELLGLTTTTAGGRAVVYLHPDRLAQVIKAHKHRPLAIAAYLHGVACHELTHLDGRMGKGHDEAFVVAREDLGHATGHLLPAIAVLAQKVLGLPVKPTDEQKQIRRLERQLARARETAKGSRAARREADRLRAALEEVRAELAEAREESARVRAACGEACGCGEASTESTIDPAVRVVDAAVTTLLTRPPAGVEPGEVAGFARRHRDRLIALVRAQVATGRPR